MDQLADTVVTYADRFKNNLSGSFSRMTAKQWIRLVIIVGTYLLVRPYLLKLGARQQMKQHEREAAQAEADARRDARILPNELRGQAKIAPVPEESDDDGEGQADGAGKGTGAEWGKKARKRQRQVIKKLLDAEEKKLAELQEDDEDKDIQEFLED